MCFDPVARDLDGARIEGASAHATILLTSNEARLAHDSIYADPKAGDQILVEAVLNIVTDITKAE